MTVSVRISRVQSVLGYAVQSEPPKGRSVRAEKHIRPSSLLGFELLEILLGILVEVLPARFAAELDFLPFVSEDYGLSHLAQLIVGDDAGGELVGLDLVLTGADQRRSDK